MITPTSERHVETTLNGRVIKMKIAANAGAKLMNILTNLYRDQETALLREYACNAHDAHIAAGQTRPIEITIPVTRLDEPVVKIQDWGVGLTVDDIEQIYSQYGASTKDDSNEFTGNFGLGCKSALTYCDQFMLVAVKDGVKVTVAVTRDDDSGGSMTVVDTCSVIDPATGESREPNGVLISIPVDYPNAFKRKADEFFRFWETFNPGAVLINGEKPTPITGLKLSDNMILAESLGSDYVVMGGVPYPTSLIAHGTYGKNLVVEVPLGVLEPQPSREAIIETSDARAIMESIREAHDKAIVKAIQDAIDAAKTPLDAVDVMLEWHRKVRDSLRPADGYIYKGLKLPLRMEAPAAGEPFMLVNGDARKLSHKSHIESYGAESWSKTFWIHGYDKPTWTPTMRKKLNYFMESRLNVREYGSDMPGVSGWRYCKFVFTKTRIKSPFINADRRIRWSEIEAIKLPRQVGVRSGGYGRIPGSYDMYVNHDRQYGVPADDIDLANPLFWFEGAIHDWEGSKFVDFIANYHSSFTVVALRPNRINKFKRNFPCAKNITDAVRELWQKESARISDYMKLAYGHKQVNSSASRFSDPDLIDDPEIQEHLLYLQEDTSELQTLMNRFSSVWHESWGIPKVQDPLRKYPLLMDTYGDFRVRNIDHGLIYINAVYAHEQQKAAEAELDKD